MIILTLIFLLLIGIFTGSLYWISKPKSNLDSVLNFKLLNLRRYLQNFNLSIDHIQDNKIWVKNINIENQRMLDKSVFYDKKEEKYHDGEYYRKEMITIPILQILPENYQFAELNEIEICNNRLINFKGFPKVVKGDCLVNNNNLTSFEDSPDFIDGTFDVRNNKIINFYGFSYNLTLYHLRMEWNPIYNLFYILKQLIPYKLFHLGTINIFNDYNCWERNGLRVNGSIFKDIVIQLIGLDFEWVPYSFTWNKNAGFNYSITAVNNDFEKSRGTVYQHLEIKWRILHQLSDKSYEEVQGFIKIKDGEQIIYIPSIYNFVFPSE